jgi:hypothetical protein
MIVNIKREYDARMWLHLAQDRLQWKTGAGGTKPSDSMKGGALRDWPSNCHLLTTIRWSYLVELQRNETKRSRKLCRN